MRGTAIALLGAVSLVCSAHGAAADPAIKIGILSDMSSVYADYGGPGSVLFVLLLFADSGMTDKVEVMSSDTQNKADIELAIAQQWFEQGVSASFDVPNSSVALAVNSAAGRAHKLVFFSTSIFDRLSEQECYGYGLSWVWDTYSVGRAEAAALMRDG